MVINRRVWDPCYPDQVALSGAIVLLKDYSGNIIDETTTNDDVYPECATVHPSTQPTSFPSVSSIPTRMPSRFPSLTPSIKTSVFPSVSPTEGMVVRRRVWDPCYDEQ
eukprot:scaffold36438_cov88-Skeletonema_marinoi.AAC.1